MTVTALPPGARLLHVGPPKTGTTAVQKAMHHGRATLAEHGVLYPGRTSRPRDASLELLRPAERRAGAWDTLVAEVAATGAERVCISSESLSLLNDAQAAEAVAGLGGDSVHVVITARPVDALLPSVWQQHVRNVVGAPSYEDWLRSVLLGAPGDAVHDRFWRLHDLADQVRRWSAAAAPERVVVLVAQEGDRSFLLHTFEDLLDLPRGTLVPRVDVSNPSLTRFSGELLLALDREAQERGWSPAEYAEKVRTDVAYHLRSRPREPQDLKSLPAWAAERAAEVNAARADLLSADPPSRVIGDPETLRPEARPIAVDPGRDGAAVRPLLSVQLAAGVAAAAVEGERGRLRAAEDRIAGLRAELARLRERPPTAGARVRRAAGRLRGAVLDRRT
ncbi:hypothetical protein [Nocardioides pantholopis]|uniref:hypothetical protein n=1 Tax=Nocardioides pantholopis TaxID=2483798 RepID=UPI000FD95A1C|nr:hypothetical protein [Nocardioides pantholopis]